MQTSFGFDTGDISFIHTTPSRRFGRLQPFQRREPIWRMVRSLIGARTYDTIGEPALERLIARWPHPRQIAEATPEEVEQVIADVTFADDKARNLVAALRWIGQEHPDYDLSFLANYSVREALTWLERLPGVGPKVAAATLNASTLRMRVFIVDSHVHRILIRFGFIGPQASAEAGRDAVTAAAASLDADGLLELFAQMKQLGQTLCRFDTPACGQCPLARRCATASRVRSGRRSSPDIQRVSGQRARSL